MSTVAQTLTRTLAIAALGSAVLVAAPAIAQTQGTQSGQKSFTTRSSPNFSQKELQSFVQAQSRIREIRSSALQKIKQTRNRHTAQQISKQARQDMLAAIKDSGLTRKTYNQIGRAANTNPEIARKIQKMR